MTDGFRRALTITDGVILLYWGITALAALGVVTLPPDALYKGYHDPLLVAWNWSFMPLDIAFSLTGLAAVRLAKSGDARWRGLAIVSLTLTMCAGGMAIGFWVLTGDFDMAWWVPNLLLLLWPLRWLPGLLRV